MKNTLQAIEKDLKVHQKDLEAMKNEMDKDDSIQDNTEWCNNFNNLQGFIEGMENSINIIKGA